MELNYRNYIDKVLHKPENMHRIYEICFLYNLLYIQFTMLISLGIQRNGYALGRPFALSLLLISPILY